MSQGNADMIVAEWNTWTHTWFKALRKAWASAAFKQQLLTEPEKALKEHFHYELPPALRLRVVEGESLHHQSPVPPSYFNRHHVVSPPFELTVPLPPAPPNVDEGLINLTNKLISPPTIYCVCACG